MSKAKHFKPLFSPVPDLLYEHEQIKRLQEISPLLKEPNHLTAQTPLHRLTVFLTYRCNLACPYCKTILRSPEEAQRLPQKRFSFDQAAFEALLKSHQPTPVRHVHFTGGEATLIQTLPTMIGFAKAHGVKHVSLTSNGIQALRVYRSLIEAGLDELRISFDTNNPELGSLFTQRPQAWFKAVKSLAGLKQLREEGFNFVLIINSVITPQNRTAIPDLLEFLDDLCAPDDIKLITEVDSKDFLHDFTEYSQIMQGIQQFLARHALERFPLLRRKMATVFSKETIGLEGLQVPIDQKWRCFIPLTERTVDSTAYYPCSVYLREGGQALGALTDTPDVQREKTLRFVEEADCLKDPICQKYCLHCTRTYNQKANTWPDA